MLDALVDGLGRLGRLGSALDKEYPFAYDKYFNTHSLKYILLLTISILTPEDTKGILLLTISILTHTH
jgi:hypothetical protein